MKLPPFRFSGPAGVERWAALSVMLALFIVGLLSWLRYEQNSFLQSTTRHWEEFRQARIELAKGFLHASLGEAPNSPFSREDGVALLGQAVASFERTVSGLDAIEAGEVRRFHRSTDEFLGKLADWRQAPDSPARMVALRIAFGDLERQTDRLDTAAQRQIKDFIARGERTFALVLIGSLLALGVIIAIVFHEERKQRRLRASGEAAERALRESEERFRLLFEEAPIPLGLVSPEGTQVALNSRFIKAFGYNQADIPDIETWWRLAYPDPDYRAQAMENWNAATARASAEGGEIDGGEYRIACKDGTTRVMLISGIVLRDGMLAAFFDVTERDRAARAIEASETMLKQAQRLGRIGSWHWNVRADLPVWSEEMYRILGRDPALGPTSFAEASRHFSVESWARLSEAVKMTLTAGVPYSCDVEVVRPDGSQRWITSQGEAVRDTSGKIAELSGTVQDITERKSAEEELRRRNEELEQFNQASVGRELEMIELKRRINALSRELGREAPFDLSFVDGPIPATGSPAP